jgi:hypothetical protein
MGFKQNDAFSGIENPLERIEGFLFKCLLSTTLLFIETLCDVVNVDMSASFMIVDDRLDDMGDTDLFELFVFFE